MGNTIQPQARPVVSTPNPEPSAPRVAPAVPPASPQVARPRDVFVPDAQATPARGAPNALAATGGTQDSGASAAGTPATLSAADEASANEAIGQAYDSRDASAVADWLEAHPDPATQAAFMDLLFSRDELAGLILDDSQWLSAADQQRISGALDRAYRSGAVTEQELSDAVGGVYAGALPGESHEQLAGIIAGTGNPELIAAYAKRELEHLRADDPQRASAIATALAGMPPEALQAFLRDNPEAVGDMLQNINAGMDSSYSPALGKLLDAASQIQPPTAESLQLFTDSIDKLGENTSSREAAARFFMRHGDAVLGSLRDASGSLGLDGQKKLSEFFTRTLFTEPEYEGQTALREDVMRRLDSLQTALNQEANASPPSSDAKRQARLMGSLVGALEGGFQVAVDELNQRNDATEGMVKLLFSAKALLPNLPLPGAGLLKNLTIDAIQKWVTESLKENAQSPADAIPFHRAFGELIANPDLRTDYDAARGDAFVNRQRGLS